MFPWQGTPWQPFAGSHSTQREVIIAFLSHELHLAGLIDSISSHERYVAVGFSSVSWLAYFTMQQDESRNSS
jgi:hypothetical protein